MHKLSKKDLNSEEMETLRRSRTPTVVVTANGEVQTNEEAQVYVHDLGLFVTVQLLEETPAVLSLGKRCEDHGSSCEWASGRKPRLTQNGETHAERTMWYLLSFQGYLPVLVRVRFQHRYRRIRHQKVQKQIDVTHTHQETGGQKYKKQNKEKNGSRDSDDRMRDPPEWLEEFADNLEDTETPVPGHVSQDSDSERPTKVVEKSNLRKHSIS